MKWLIALVTLLISQSLASPQKLPAGSPQPSKCLVWAISDEARGEPLRGARAVLDVIYERMKRSGKSACQIVKQPAQFSGYRQGVKMQIDENMLTRFAAVDKMLPVCKGCTHFHSKKVQPSWRKKLKRVIMISNHIFYKPKEKQNDANRGKWF
jgi:N-acetylmuramoyl-L-alanine amidase